MQYLAHLISLIEFSKINRGFAAFQKNTGQLHPSQSQTIQARATGADPLTDDDQELWQGTISVGSPAEQFTG
jgi:cathepsin D